MSIKRYNQFINESLLISKEDEKLIFEESERIAEYIKGYCYPYIQEHDGFKDKAIGLTMMLYRGNTKKMVEGEINSFKVRKLRTPMTTSMHTQNIIDDMFEEKFNVRPRGSSVFATSRLSSAEYYGDTHLFFPKGEFKCIWSDEIEDLYVELKKRKLAYPATDSEFLALKKIIDTYKVGDLQSALYSGNEIMFLCDEYFLIDRIHKNNLIKLLFP